MCPAALVNAVVQCEGRTASGGLTFKQLHDVSCARLMSPAQKKKQKGGRSSIALTHNNNLKKPLMPEMSMMAIAAFWLNIPEKGKMNGEMIFYFPGRGCWWQCVSAKKAACPDSC